MNLFECDHNTLITAASLQGYIDMIIPAIGMVAHGPTYIERFGSGDLEGFSAMQFIETSSITIHADEVDNRCFVDIFTCKDFDTEDAIEKTREYFKAKTVTSHVMDR